MKRTDVTHANRILAKIIELERLSRVYKDFPADRAITSNIKLAIYVQGESKPRSTVRLTEELWETIGDCVKNELARLENKLESLGQCNE